MAVNNEYTSESIVTYEGLQAVRNRPTQYIPSLDVGGLIHMLWEYISNSVDEMILKSSGTITIGILRNQSTNEVQVLIADEGRGVPTDSVVRSYTVLNTSGKFNQSGAYTASAGQFGVGAKLGPALSKNFRVVSRNIADTRAVSLTTADGEIVNTYMEESTIPNGVTAILQPDMSEKFFAPASEFAVTGYIDLVSLCRRLNVFNENLNFKIFLVDKFFPKHIWSDSITDMFNTINSYFNARSTKVLYDSTAVSDKSDYLFEIWRTNSPVIFRDTFQKYSPDKNIDKLGFDVRIFFTKRSAYGNTQYFITINNAELADKTLNSATVVALEVLREFIIKHFKEEDELLRDFVKCGDYTFPTLYLAIGIMYDGAQLGGTTKSTFRDKAFENQFRKELTDMFNAKSDEYVTQFMNLIGQDIQDRYNALHSVPKKNDANKVLTELNFRENFYECKITGDPKSELFLVEGTSAGNIVATRNNDYQAVYLTRGKPTNAATRAEQISDNKQRLLKDPIYEDIIKLLHIDPNSKDISSRMFNKIIIATDADPDGSHIRSLHLNNLYIINPLIVTSGLVWLSNPPLYSMQVNNRYLFLRDKVAMMDAKIEFLYKNAFELSVIFKTPKESHETIPDPDTFREIMYMIHHVGSQFKLVASQLNIPILILERLVYALPALFPVVKPDELNKYFVSSDGEDYVDVVYQPSGNYIVVSLGKQDYPIGLNEIGKTIKEHILPLVKKFRYNNIFFKFRGKTKNTQITKPTTISPMQLFNLLEELDTLVKIHRYKGLGEMPTESCAETIMNPATRSITQVINEGSMVENYALLGKDTSTRKALLTVGGAATTAFIQQHNREELFR